MDGNRLILADGSVIEGGQAGYSQGYLWLTITGLTLKEASVIFFDTARTREIRFQYGEMEDVYEGFTDCTNLQIDVDAVVSVCLRKALHA